MKKAIYIMATLAIISLIVMVVAMCTSKKGKSTDSDKVTISRSILTNLINQASDVKIVTRDTIIYKDRIVVKDHNVPIPAKLNDSTRIYTDHIKNSEIDITLTDSIQGTLLRRSFSYIPIVKLQKIEVTKTIPQLIDIEPPAPVPKLQLQLAMLATTQDFKSGLIGAEIGLINKNKIGLHYLYQTNFNNIKFHSIKISKTFNF